MTEGVVSLEELVREAEEIGRLTIFGQEGGGYRAKIEISAPRGVTIEASSEFRRPFKSAILEAILTARRLTGDGAALQDRAMGEGMGEGEGPHPGKPRHRLLGVDWSRLR